MKDNQVSSLLKNFSLYICLSIYDFKWIKAFTTTGKGEVFLGAD